LVARCESMRTTLDEVAVPPVTIPITVLALGAIHDLPDPAPDTLYIVSAIAARAAHQQGRRDVVMPDDTVRDSDGRIIGCRSLARPN